MHSLNFRDKINAYLDKNPELKPTDIGVLLLLEDFYKDIPEDIKSFRKLHSYFDPIIVDKDKDITFERIAKLSKENEIKEAICSYLNIKFTQITQNCNLQKNLETFTAMSQHSEKFIKDILHFSGLPEKMKIVFKESKIINNEHNLLNLISIYKKTKSKRLKFEILRRVSIIDILSRIKKHFLEEDIDYALKDITKFFFNNLGLESKNKEQYYFWIDQKDHTQETKDKSKAIKEHKQATILRKEYGQVSYLLQKIIFNPYKTKYGNKILKFEVRNKLKKHGEKYYSSFVEKMIRKNLEFPNQVHDLIGLRIITQTSEEIPKLISHLEKFLGGTSSRKKEKNNLHLFGKRILGEFSSKQYSVWKAIYDISLPSPRIDELDKILPLIKDPEIKRKIEERRSKLKELPNVMVIEVQLQDLKSYLAGITKGSPTDHAKLKMNQVRGNSFYKVFPKEIYDKELLKLKKSILTKTNPKEKQLKNPKEHQIKQQ